MNLWQWIRAYWKGYTVVIATPRDNYRVIFLKGQMRMTKEIPELRGSRMEMVWYDESI